MIIAWKICSLDDKYSDTVFTDWFKLCAHIMAHKKTALEGFRVETCVIMDIDEVR